LTIWFHQELDEFKLVMVIGYGTLENVNLTCYGFLIDDMNYEPIQAIVLELINTFVVIKTFNI